jgi:hypothetical protein
VKQLRVLDFDIENRPLSYLGQDFTTAEVTAIAAGFVGETKVQCWLLGPVTAKAMLEGFRAMYDQADIVTGHYIRKHDLPIINGALIELGLPPLAPKLSSDTKLDLIRFYGISKAQENLAQMLGLAEEKTHMSNASWREANRLTARGLAKTRARCVGDVLQHMAMREKLVRRGLLGRPKVWRP